jgi:ubiquinone/menaquinone biosynthesis C-methylase UbiE
MGRWSAKLAPGFLQFACIGEPRSVLDIGCGTGSLLRVGAGAFPHSYFVGLDPYLPFALQARTTSAAPLSSFVIGTTEALPFRDGAFDYCLSLLLLQEIRDRTAALREMRRVTRIDGIVAACQWDFENGMPMLSALREALALAVPSAYRRSETGSARAFTSLDELKTHWLTAGFAHIHATELTATMTYEDFSDFWAPILSGSTPMSAIVAGLPLAAREAVRRKVMEIVPGAADGSSFALTARAFAVRGQSRDIQNP